MDFFEMFGIQPDEQSVNSAKKTEKKSEKKVEKKKNENKTEKKETFKLPITIYTGFREPLVLSGDTKVTKEELLQKLEKSYPEYKKSYTCLEVIGDKAWAAPADSRVQEKGTIHLTKSTKLTLAGEDIDLSGVMTDEDCMVELDELSKHLCTLHPVFENVGIVSEADQMLPVIRAPFPDSDLTFPIRLLIYGRDKWKVTEEEYEEFWRANGNEGDVSFSVDCLKDMVAEKYPEFKNHLELRYLQNTNIVAVVMHVTEKKGKSSSDGKNETYPVTGTTLSFIFKKITLSPEMFGGKESVTKKELISSFADLYPEFKEDRTEIIYDKERNMLMPLLRGSKKGAI